MARAASSTVSFLFLSEFLPKIFIVAQNKVDINEAEVQPYKESLFLSASVPVCLIRGESIANFVTEQSDVCLYLLAIFLPPLAVFLDTGCSADFLINILLSILGWIPGVIREWILGGVGMLECILTSSDAWWIISKHDPAKYT